MSRRLKRGPRQFALTVINLEEGRPSVGQVRSRLADELDRARQQGLPALKLIHGYGSSGVGGALRDAVLGVLGWAKTRGEIREFIAGEEWTISDTASWRLLQHRPGLRSDSDLGRRNRGITIVIL